MAHHVYLSYATGDEAVANIVRTALQDNGIPVWMREATSRSRDIVEAAKNAVCFVAIFSPNAKDSRQIHEDFESNDLPVFPLLVAGDFRHSVVYGFLNALIYDARGDFKGGLRQLIADLKDFYTQGSDKSVRDITVPAFQAEFTPRPRLPIKHDVYISYRHLYADLMREIRAKLQREGLSVWVDKFDMDPAASWRTEIQNAIEQARSIVVIITPVTKDSRFVPEDIEYARQCGVPVYTLLAEGDFSDVLPGLRVGTILDYRKENEWKRLIEALRDLAGETAVPQPAAVTPGSPTDPPPTAAASPAPPVPSESDPEHYNVFLSFSSKDATIMKRICDDLRAVGLTVWTMKDGIPVGTASWRKEIEKAIKASDCMVVLFSPDANDSKWVGEELSYAELQKKPIIPLLVRGEPKDALPYGYTLAQNIDFRTDADYIKGLPRLIASIKRHVRSP